LCRLSVEDEWLESARDGAPSIDGGPMWIYQDNQECWQNLRSAGAIRGKWGLLDEKDDEWSVINSELQGGSLRLC
jgi:hypothetical protein